MKIEDELRSTLNKAFPKVEFKIKKQYDAIDIEWQGQVEIYQLQEVLRPYKNYKFYLRRHLEVDGRY